MKITLIKPHTHAGQPYQPGAELDVDDLTGRWLKDQQIGKPSKTKTQPAKADNNEDPQ
ncbi:DUF7210 family protein [Leminorella grimontii]|uniref:DUF7210 family protein n=1 Tax=Leminorella grimontii TaxID=82981 RepID=UPI00322057C7